MKNAVIYARTSSLTQKNNDTIDTQIRELQAYCKTNRINIVHTYKDDGVSANAPDRLDDLVDFLNEYRSEIDCIVFRSTTRLARNVVKYILFEEECKKMGLTMISCESGVIEYEDGEDPDGTKQLIRMIEAWVSERELKKITKRLTRGRKDKALARGIKSQGACAFGYKYAGESTKDKHVVIDEAEAAVVKEVFDTFQDTRSTSRTAKAMNAKGYVNKRGSEFSKQGVQVILQNDFYAGKIGYNGEKVDGKHTAIISKNQFTRVQNIFKKPGE